LVAIHQSWRIASVCFWRIVSAVIISFMLLLYWDRLKNE
jgi:hypothetical protein